MDVITSHWLALLRAASASLVTRKRRRSLLRGRRERSPLPSRIGRLPRPSTRGASGEIGQAGQSF